ncbi:MAG: hypothetical protein JKY70_12615 [Mucilaginibacter sp.]|nr:hypothetical protein [Mucilaginibacter sp.]
MTQKIEKGQIWTYNNREGEDDSFIVIIKLDDSNSQNPVAHVSTENLSKPGSEEVDTTTWSIGHAPVQLGILAGALKTLKGYREIEFNEGYTYWKEEYDKGKAGVWSIPINEMIDLIQETGFKQ